MHASMPASHPRAMHLHLTAQVELKRHSRWIIFTYPLAVNQIADNLWILSFPHTIMGAQFGRNVTIIRLRNGQLVIHSTAPFAAEHISVIQSLGQPAYLLD